MKRNLLIVIGAAALYLMPNVAYALKANLPECSGFMTTLVAVSAAIEADTIPPVFDDFPEIFSIACAVFGPDDYPTATDNLDTEVDVQILSMFELSGECSEWWLITFIATDDCGNTATIELVLELFNDTGPVIYNVPSDQYLPCDALVPSVPLDVIAVEVCGEVVSLEMVVTSGGDVCEQWITRTWTAVNNCGNLTGEAYTIYFIDNEPPVIEGVPSSASISCVDQAPAPPIVEITDNCSGGVEMVFTESVIGGGSLPGDPCVLLTPEMDAPVWSLALFEFLGGQGYYITEEGQITYTPDMGSGASAQITATLVSSTNPNGGFYLTLDLINGMNWNTWSNQAWPTSYKDDWNLAGNNYLNWIYYIVSNTSSLVGFGDYTGSLINLEHAPSSLYFGFQLGEAANNASAAYGIGGWVTYSGNFIDLSQGVDIDVSGGGDVAFELDCLGGEGTMGGCPESSIIYTWTVTDICGNTATATQTITIVDNEPPVIHNVPASIIVGCSDDMPELPDDVYATDNCSDVVELVFSTTLSGDPLVGGELGDCIAFTPAMDAPVWSLALFEFLGGQGYYTTQTGQLTHLPDMVDGAAAQITATLVSSDNPNGGFYLNLDLASGMDWNTWSNQAWPTSYKDDWNLAGNNYLDWIYYIIGNTSSLIGWGDYEGSLLYLEHAPSSLYFGFQLGIAANNASAGYGGGGWATYSGTFIDLSQGINQEVSGGSDLAFELECTNMFPPGCPEGGIVNTWTATDDCGNVTVATQTITIVDNEPPVIHNVPASIIVGCSDDMPELPDDVYATDNCSDVVELVFSTTLSGDPLVGGELGDCIAFTPAMDAPVWSLALFEFLGGQGYYTTQTGQLTHLPDMVDGAAAQITATLVSSDNPNGGFYLNLDLASGMDWNTWSNQAWPTSYKDDWNLAGNNYLDWIYYIIGNTSSLIGWGDYEGSLLYLEHAPSSLYFGFQLGIAANNASAGYGGGGWATYSGTFIDLSQGINQEVSGGSDLAFELECTNMFPPGCPEGGIVNTWTATDACGNVTVATQTITIVDNEPPVIHNVPASIDLECNDAVPPLPDDVYATDNCSDVSLVFNQTIVEGFPSGNECFLLPPQMLAPEWSLTLLEFMGSQVYFTLQEGQLITGPETVDGSTAQITATLNSSSNPNGGFYLTLDLINGMDWNSWSNQAWPTSYKDDWNFAGNNYLNWTYYIISNTSVLVGFGDYEGSVLNLEHAPSNLYYGYQLGQAANNLTAAFGSGGWTTYSGTFIDSSQGINTQVSGGSDLAFEHECTEGTGGCPESTIINTWTATDVCGNVTVEEQIITIGGTEPLPTPSPSCSGDFNNDQHVNVQDLLHFSSHYGCIGGNCSATDMNNDSFVNATDLLVFIGFWGNSCP